MRRTFAALMLAVMFATFTSTAHADDCKSAVDKICKAFNGMTAQVNRVTSIEGFDTLDFDAANADLYSISDSCANYHLTSDDKAKLRKSFNGFCNAMVDKLYSFVGSMVSRDVVEAQIMPMNEAFNNVLDNSDTLMELVDGLNKVFQ